MNVETLADANTRPAWITTYEGQDEEGNAVERYSIKLPKMKNGDTFVGTISGEPANWQEYEGQFGPSVMGFFEMEDGSTLSCFIGVGEKPTKTKGIGKSLHGVLCEDYAEGDTVRITLNEIPSKKFSNPTKLFVVESADFQ